MILPALHVFCMSPVSTASSHHAACPNTIQPYYLRCVCHCFFIVLALSSFLVFYENSLVCWLACCSFARVFNVVGMAWPDHLAVFTIKFAACVCLVTTELVSITGGVGEDTTTGCAWCRWLERSV